jgi:hypothetical protein
MNGGVSDARGFGVLLTSSNYLVIESHYLVIPVYIYVNRVTRELKWNTGRCAEKESVRIGWIRGGRGVNSWPLFLWSDCLL